MRAIMPMRWRASWAHAGVERAVVVGHSLGALVASAFAAKYPRRVRYLVLADVAQGTARRSRNSGKKSGRVASS